VPSGDLPGEGSHRVALAIGGHPAISTASAPGDEPFPSTSVVYVRHGVVVVVVELVRLMSEA